MKRYEILEAIENYGLQSYPAPTTYYDILRSDFEDRCYKNWAVEYLLDYLWKKEAIAYPIVDRIEMFKKTMGEYAMEHKTIDATYMFSIAEDVATDILDFVISLLTWRSENE